VGEGWAMGPYPTCYNNKSGGGGGPKGSGRSGAGCGRLGPKACTGTCLAPGVCMVWGLGLGSGEVPTQGLPGKILPRRSPKDGTKKKAGVNCPREGNEWAGPEPTVWGPGSTWEVPAGVWAGAGVSPRPVGWGPVLGSGHVQGNG